MERYKKIPQTRFDSLGHFIEHSNNYWNWWTEYDRGVNMRKEPPFQRFMKKYPKFSKRLIKKTTEAFMDRHSDIPFEQRLPWKELYASYKKISELVFEEDFLGKDYSESFKQFYLLG